MLADKLDRTDDALDLANQFLAVHPKHRDVLAKTADLFERKKDWPNVISSLKKLVEQVHGAAAIDIHERLARIYEGELSDPAQAVTEYEAVLRIDSQNLGALTTMARIFERTGDIESLISILRRRIPLLKGEKEIAAAFRRMGEAARDGLKDDERAAEFFEQSLAHDFSQTDIADFLADHYRAQERFRDLAEILQKRLKRLSGIAAIPVLFELSEIWMDRLSNPVQALSFLN